MNDEQKKEILFKLKFLKGLNYIEEEYEYGIKYISSKVILDFYRERYSDAFDASILFVEKNKCFSIGWIYYVRTNNVCKNNDCFSELLDIVGFFIKEYNNLLDINYCEDSNNMIEDYMDNIRKKN